MQHITGATASLYHSNKPSYPLTAHKNLAVLPETMAEPDWTSLCQRCRSTRCTHVEISGERSLRTKVVRLVKCRCLKDGAHAHHRRPSQSSCELIIVGACSAVARATGIRHSPTAHSALAQLQAFIPVCCCGAARVGSGEFLILHPNITICERPEICDIRSCGLSGALPGPSFLIQEVHRLSSIPYQGRDDDL